MNAMGTKLSVRFAEQHEMRDFGGASGPSGFLPLIGTVTVNDEQVEFRGFDEGVDLVLRVGEMEIARSLEFNGKVDLEKLMTLVAQMRSVETDDQLTALGFGPWRKFN